MPQREEENRTARSPGGGPTRSCEEVSELLPVYLNGSLKQEEARRVEAHLASCTACRREERDTRAAFALYEGHLPVELLLDHALAQPMSAQRLAVVESHLAACERCSEEVAMVRREHAVGATMPEPVRGRLRPPGARSRVPLASLRQDRGRLRTLAWAASLAAVVASAGWVWTWRQLTHERALSSAPTARANLSVVELLPATQPLLRQGSADPRAAANRVELSDGADEVVLMLLSGGRSCESGCILEIYEAGEARLKWRVEGLVASPDGHVTLALPSDWLSPEPIVLAVRDRTSSELVTEYLVELRHSP